MKGFNGGGGEEIPISLNFEYKARLPVFYAALVQFYVTSVKHPGGVCQLFSCV